MSIAQFTMSRKPVVFSSHDRRAIALYDLIRQCIINEQPMVVLYATQGIEMKARVLHPIKLHTSKAGADLVKAHDSLTNETKDFRADRIKAFHHLTTA